MLTSVWSTLDSVPSLFTGMLTNYLLCVLIVQVAYVLGEISGRQPPVEERPNRGLIMLASLAASLVAGFVLLFVLITIVIAFGQEGSNTLS